MKFLICQNVPKGNIKIDHLVYKKCIDNQVNAQYVPCSSITYRSIRGGGRFCDYSWGKQHLHLHSAFCCFIVLCAMPLFRFMQGQ